MQLVESYQECVKPNSTKPSSHHLQVFLVQSLYEPDQKRPKIDDQSAKYVLIGYDARTSCKLYDPILKKVVISRDEEFNEEFSWDWNVKKENGSYDYFS